MQGHDYVCIYACRFVNVCIDVYVHMYVQELYRSTLGVYRNIVSSTIPHRVKYSFPSAQIVLCCLSYGIWKRQL